MNYLGSTNGITEYEGIEKLVNHIPKIYREITASTVIIDCGSSDGSALNSFRKLTGVDRAIGIEFIESRFLESSKRYPECEFHFDRIENRLDLIESSDIIFMNNICFPQETFWDVYKSAKSGSLIIYNRITVSFNLRRFYGYEKTEINKIHILSNHMKSEYHIIIKK